MEPDSNDSKGGPPPTPPTESLLDVGLSPRVLGLEFWVWGLGFRALGLGFRVLGLLFSRFRVWDRGCVNGQQG